MGYKTPTIRSVDTLIMALCVVVFVGFTLNEFDPHRTYVKGLWHFATQPFGSGNLRMAESVELYYFPSRGRAEALRLLLSANNLTFANRELTPEGWQDMKKDNSRAHFGQLPVLHATFHNGDDIWVSQSGAIARWISRAGVRPLACESVACDELQGFAEDIRGKYVKFAYGNAKDAKLVAEYTKTLAAQMEVFEAWLASRPGRFATGAEVTFVDALLFDAIEAALKVVPKAKTAAFLKPTPSVSEWFASVQAHEWFAPYLKSAERAARKQNGKSANFDN
jgi:glutathione S-transferase P